MANESEPVPDLDERSIARRYGLRELVEPDSDQVRAINAFLDATILSGRCGPIPRTAVMATVEFLQAILNRQHLTKGPRMTHEEFDALQTPYYLAARIIGRIQRQHSEGAPGTVYQKTYLSLNHFIELLRNVLDPGCYWLRWKAVPAGVVEIMSGLREFLTAWPEQRRKGRAL